MLERHHAGFDPAGHTELMPAPAGLLAAAQAEQRLVRIEPELYDYLLGITRRTREWPSLDARRKPARCHQPDARRAVLCGARWPRFRDSR